MLQVKPFQWVSQDWKGIEGDKFGIVVFAHTTENETIALNISDVEPWLHVILPDDIPQAIVPTACRDIFNELVRKLAKDSHSPTRYEVANRLPFYYYTVKENTCMKIHFTTENAARHCANLLKWPVKNYKLTAVEIDFKLGHVERFHAELQLRPCDWIEVDGVLLRPDDPSRITTLAKEYDVPWKSVKTLPPEQQAKLGNVKPSLLVFDYEMYSARKFAFPEELNSTDCVFMGALLYMYYDKQKGQYAVNEYCLVYHKSIKKEQIRPIPYTTLKRVSNQQYEIGEDNSRHVELLWFNGELDMLNGVEAKMIELNPDAVVGHNSNGFDFKYHKVRKGRMHERYQNLSRISTWIQGFKHIEWSSSAYRNIELDVPDGAGRIYFDTLLMAKRDLKEDSYGLDSLCQTHMGIGKHDWSAQNIFESFEENDAEKLRKTIVYCLRDVWCTFGLFDHFNYFPSYSGMSSVIGIPIFDLFAEGQGRRTVTQVFKECFKMGYYLQTADHPTRTIAGGHVFPQKPGLYEWLWLLDFEGLYPSIIDAYNLSNDTYDHYGRADDKDCYVFEWEDAEGKWKTRFVKPHLRQGIVPLILRSLKKSRKESKDIMAACKAAGDKVGEMNANVEQNAKKVSMNSVYGALAQGGGKLGLCEAGATVTYIGRTLVKQAAAWAEKEGYEVVYGDSVTGEMPILLRLRGDLVIEMSIETFYNNCSNVIPIEDTTSEHQVDQQESIPKEYRLAKDLEAWSEQGWTPIRNVMRHKTSKKIYRVETFDSYIDVTEDHSMLLEDGTPITPKELKLGDKLLVSHCVDLSTRNPDLFPLKQNVVLAIRELEQTDRYVYDLTTENHHFQAGVGGIIVHNTDSIMIRRIAPLSDDEKRNFEELGKAFLARLNAANFKPPIGMAMDGVFRTFLTLEKKMYSFVKWDKDNPLGITAQNWSSKGMVTARRDSCKMIRRLYKRLNVMITTLVPVEEVVLVLFDEINRLLYGKLEVEEMVTIKALGSDYAKQNIPMAIYSRHLADKGMNVKAGDRLPYVFKINPKGKRDGDYYEDPELFVREGMEFNRMMYLKSQFANKLDKLLHVSYPSVIPPEFLIKLKDSMSCNPNATVEEVLTGMMITWTDAQ